MAGALALVSACARKGPEAERLPPARAAEPPPDAARAFLPVMSAVRCEECHGKMADEWRVSAHARSDRTPLYRAMRARAAALSVDVAACDRCHAPFAGLADPTEPGAHEGVTCDVCHTIKQVELRPEGSVFAMHAEESVKYAELCDAQDHYFHKMGCSPLHQESVMCGACHLLHRRTASGEDLPVYTEYEEWRASPLAAEGMECQRCHMPGDRAEAAKGSPARGAIGHHGFLGRDGGLRRRAIRLQLALTGTDGNGLHLAATVENVGAGHRVPSGLPGRELLLRARTLESRGAPTPRGKAQGPEAAPAQAEQRFARIPCDASGKPVPSFAASRICLDNRIAPRERREVTLDLASGSAGEVEVTLLWRELAPELAAPLGIEPREEKLLEARLPFEAPVQGGRPRLKRSVTLDPTDKAGRGEVRR